MSRQIWTLLLLCAGGGVLAAGASLVHESYWWLALEIFGAVMTGTAWELKR